MLSVNKLIAALALCLVLPQVWGHEGVVFIENKGQWHENINYRARLFHGDMFFERDGLTYSFYDKSIFSAMHASTEFPDQIKGHVVKTKFVGSQATSIIATNPTVNYYNYFIGNDPSKWASKVRSYRELKYTDIYPSTDLKVYQYAQYLKYDFIVHPGGDPDEIGIAYEGQDDIYLEESGILVVKTTMYDIREQAPIAYQMIDGEEVEVPCVYKLEGNQLGFHFPEGYDETIPLIIDPILVFSTYTGSTADNFGFTATYDDNGNAYGGGTVYEFQVSNNSGSGIGIYPSSAGAFQTTFQGGQTDIGISKFNPSGTALLYSTYIGGGSAEAPHSIICDSQGNLFVMGTTSSIDYPVTAGAYQPAFGGGTSTQPPGVNYTDGSDIVVTKISPDGTTLLGSTYVGGTANDGLNAVINLRYFYGDHFRGEINLDPNDNPIVCTTTRSNDFPVTAGAPQPGFGGGTTDAVLFKLNANCSNMLFSTYWGGSDNDCGYGVQADGAGNLFITGGTASADMLTTGGAYQGGLLGAMDGYVAKFNPAGGAVLASTYLGTNGYEQSYLIQLNQQDEVYMLGISDDAYPVTAGAYSDPGSHQFIQKLDNNLTTSLMSTVVGAGTPGAKLAPTAFLVNNCGHIYLSGWAGPLNDSYGLTTGSTTSGFFTTGNATQATTDGNDFYLMVLDTNAVGVIYATFFGANSTSGGEHVDGGTSRFDKEGMVYQAVCAGCGGNSSFPTSPGAWSETNNSGNCNLAIFKYDLNEVVAQAAFTSLSPTCALPFEVSFDNTSSGAIEYIWDYGDNSGTSTALEESHFYTAPGTYQVMLIAIDSTTCMLSDTTFLEVFVPAQPTIQVGGSDTVCVNDSVNTLNAFAPGADTYQWIPSLFLDDPTSATPIANPEFDMDYTVVVTDTNGCMDTGYVSVYVYSEVFIDAGPEVIVDIGEEMYLQGYVPPGTISYWWDPPNGLSCTDCLNPMVNPTDNTVYTLYAVNEYGCLQTDTVQVFVTSSFYVPNAFTPNNNGVNEEFKPIATGVDFYEFYVFNRWGEIVFQTTDPNVGWNGRFAGKQSPSDVYVWMAKYTDFLQPQVIHQKYGHVTLVR